MQRTRSAHSDRGPPPASRDGSRILTLQAPEFCELFYISLLDAVRRRARHSSNRAAWTAGRQGWRCSPLCLVAAPRSVVVTNGEIARNPAARPAAKAASKPVFASVRRFGRRQPGAAPSRHSAISLAPAVRCELKYTICIDWLDGWGYYLRAARADAVAMYLPVSPSVGCRSMTRPFGQSIEGRHRPSRLSLMSNRELGVCQRPDAEELVVN